MSKGEAPVTVSEEAALRVVKGSLAASLAGGIFGSIYGVIRAQPATLLAAQGGANCFVFAFPFFALREYALSPILEPNQTSVTIDRTHKLASTAVSASLVGGSLAWYFRGPKKFVPGITTFGLLCTALQVVGNEARIQRFNYLAARERAKSTALDVALPVNGSDATTRPPPPGEVASATVESPQPVEATSEPTQSWWKRSWSSLASLSPIRKVSDEEYEKILQEKKADIQRQLAEIDEQILKEGQQGSKKAV